MIRNSPLNVWGTSYPSYIQIRQGIGGYAGAIGGGIQAGVGGFTTLYSVNAGTYSEMFRVCWNGSTLNSDLNMATKTLTCGTLNCGPINCTQTAATLPTAATQIGFVYT